MPCITVTKASTTQPADGEIPAGDNLDPLFDVLLHHIPPPAGDPDAPLQAWHWAAFAGRPLAWFAAAVVGFGVAAGEDVREDCLQMLVHRQGAPGGVDAQFFQAETLQAGAAAHGTQDAVEGDAVLDTVVLRDELPCT